MKSILSLLFVTLLLTPSAAIFAQEYSDQDNGIDLNDSSFPWELVLNRGKILGCIYENKFYSLGSILVLESLPRKCGQASDRNGIWEQLSEDELALFKENIETQRKLERESTYIGKEPISAQEARMIRYVRRIKEFAEKSEN